VRDRCFGDETLLAAVLGDESHAGADGGAGIARTYALAVELHGAGVVAVHAEDRAGDLAATRTDEPGERDDLTGPDLEGHVVEDTG
jgi:hypothetical protein